MGVVTHEISHLKDLTHHSQQDKNTTKHQCEQCIGHADIANGIPSQAVNFVFSHSVPTIAIYVFSQFVEAQHHPYSARAPPLNS